MELFARAPFSARSIRRARTALREIQTIKGETGETRVLYWASYWARPRRIDTQIEGTAGRIAVKSFQSLGPVDSRMFFQQFVELADTIPEIRDRGRIQSLVVVTEHFLGLKHLELSLKL